MNRVIRNYGNFLKKTSRVFGAATAKHNVTCRRGCNECCSNGFFDVTLLDAIYLRDSLKKVPASVRKRVLAKAEEQLDILEKKKVFFRKDPLLRTLKDIDKVSRNSIKMSCPALDNGVCLIYKHRAHICRIFGPTIRGARRAVRLEGCGYFTREIPETDFPILDNYGEEETILKAMYTKAGRKRARDLDTIIPAALTLDMSKWL